MNQPFQELAERAGFKLIRENCYDVVSTMSVQEFAELIVRECAKVSERTGALNELDFEGEMIADAIKEHFGVKE